MTICARPQIKQTPKTERILPYLAAKLREKRCSYAVESIKVDSFGLKAYGYPLNHGLIRPHFGGSQYLTIERGSPTGQGTSRRRSTFDAITFLQFARLVGAGYTMGRGSTVSLVPFDPSGFGRDFKLRYKGFEDDCWSHIERVAHKAGLPDVVENRVEDQSQYDAWYRSSTGGKFLRGMGAIGTPQKEGE